MERPNECGKVFLEEQGKLFDEPVVTNLAEAIEFLEDCFAQELKNIKEVREYLEELGMDTTGESDEELEQELEVFKLPDGTYFVVEA
ncbi:MAG: glyoxalase [Lachnospiraceae bacterium]